MTRLPVYAGAASDQDRDDMHNPIGKASTWRGAARVLRAFYRGCGGDRPAPHPNGPRLAERWGLWGWFDEPAA